MPQVTNFCRWATRSTYFLHISFMLGTLDLMVWSLWAPCNFLRAQPWVDIPKKSQTSRNFHFITSCLLRDFPSLPNSSKIYRFLEEVCFSTQTDLLRVDTTPPPPPYKEGWFSSLSFKSQKDLDATFFGLPSYARGDSTIDTNKFCSISDLSTN